MSTSPEEGTEGDPGDGGRARLDALERRCRRLRRSQRRLRWALVLLGVLATVPILTAAAPDGPRESLEARELRIVEEDGTTRMVISPQVSQEALFYGRRVIRRSPDAAAIVFHDGDGMEQGALAVGDRGGLMMGMDSKTGQNGGLFVSPDGRTVDLSFWLTRGPNHRLELEVDAEDGPALEMVRDGETVVRLPRDTAASRAEEGADE